MRSATTATQNQNSALKIDSQAQDHAITKTAAHLSIVEVGIGGFVHGFKIPFGGHFLSLNQGLYLCRALENAKTKRQGAVQSIEISGVASVLKSLSPAGQKIGPMLSIGMQGFLFSVGILVGGLGIFGQILAMLLLSLWAFLQPFLSLFVIYGSDLQKVLSFYGERIGKDGLGLASSVAILVGILVCIKLILASLIPILLWQMSSKATKITEEKYFRFFSKWQPQRPPQAKPSPARGALQDMTRPLFMLSTVLILCFFLLTESSATKIFWYSMRPLAMAFVLFYLIRSDVFLNALATLAQKNQFLTRIYLRAQQTRLYLDKRVQTEAARRSVPRSE